MAGPALGPAIAQGAAAGFQGQNLVIQQLLARLAAQAQGQQNQGVANQQAGQGGAYDAISKLFGAGGPGAPPQPGMSPPQPGMSPPPGQASQPMAPQPGMSPQPAPGGGPPSPGAAPGGGMAGAAPGVGGPVPSAAPPSPARAVLQGQQPQVPQQAPTPPPQSMDLQSLIGAIDKAMPNAPPQAKMAALEKVSGLMTAQAQTQYAHMKQQFDMQMQVAKLTQQAQNQLQQSMDRNASIDQRRDAAEQHNETMAAIAQLTASTRESVADKQTTSRERNVDVQQAGATGRNDARLAQKSVETERANALKEKLAGLKLTPDQQLLQGQLKSLTSRANAVVAAAGPNSPAAKAFEIQIRAVNDKLEQSLAQPAATGPTQPTANTRPPIPADLVGKDVQYNPTTREYREKPKGEGGGGDEGPDEGGDDKPPQTAAAPRKVTVTQAMADKYNSSTKLPGGGDPMKLRRNNPTLQMLEDMRRRGKAPATSSAY